MRQEGNNNLERGFFSLSPDFNQIEKLLEHLDYLLDIKSSSKSSVKEQNLRSFQVVLIRLNNRFSPVCRRACGSNLQKIVKFCEISRNFGGVLAVGSFIC